MSKEETNQQRSDIVPISDEDGVKDVISAAVLGLWDVVNNLMRLRPSRRDRYRVTIFGSARIQPGSFGYEETKRVYPRNRQQATAGALPDWKSKP